MRVHELAKELGVSSKELLAALGDMGVTGKSASSSVPEDIVPRYVHQSSLALIWPRAGGALPILGRARPVAVLAASLSLSCHVRLRIWQHYGNSKAVASGNQIT